MIPMPEIVGDFGATVYVRLGNAEIKRGTLAGARVTVGPPAGRGNPVFAKAEICVEWANNGSRPQGTEWFDANLVFPTPETAYTGPLARDTYVWPKKEGKT